jgi:hypothetical protein
MRSLRLLALLLQLWSGKCDDYAIHATSGPDTCSSSEPSSVCQGTEEDIKGESTDDNKQHLSSYLEFMNAFNKLGSSWSHYLPLLKKKWIIPNTVLPLPNKNQNVRLSALFRPSIICPKNVTDSPTCEEMLAYGKFVDMADQGHFTEGEIEAMDEQHQKKMDQRKKDG